MPILNLGIPKETAEGETRVALIPETVRKLVRKNVAVQVERGAGTASRQTDEMYEKEGATIVEDAWKADVVVKINPPSPGEVEKLGPDTLLISLLFPRSERERVEGIAARGGDALAVDMIPRTTLAQAMDVLSSQANLAGYKAVVLAADHLDKFLPMLMTAAGTVRPARLLVLGAGVAGLQAIATGRRLGAAVEAFDVRAAAREQVESLGARFVSVDDTEDASGTGGYAKETSDDYRKKQADLIAGHLAKSDICITTALIPGRPAPVLLTEEMVKGMPDGGVIVDLAAPMGGNCALTEPGSVVEKEGVTILGHLNLPAMMPRHASRLYSNNMEKLVLHLAGGEGLDLDREDEIIRGALVVRKGEIVHPDLKENPS